MFEPPVDSRGVSAPVSPRALRFPATACASIIIPLLIVLLAGSLRWADIRSVGIRYDDEAAYALDARMWHRCAKLAFDTTMWSAALRGDREYLKRRYHEARIDFGARYLKPSQGYTFLAAAAMFAGGDDPSTLHVLNALFGTASVLLLYMIGARLFNARTAALAAFLLAVSPLDLNYSRSAWAVASAIAFQLAAYFLWLRSRDGGSRRGSLRVAAGGAMGCAIACHYTSAVMAVPILMSEIMNSLRARAPRSVVRTAIPSGCFVAGMLTPLVAIELLLRSARWVLSSVDSNTVLPTLWDGFHQWGALVRSMQPDGGGIVHPGVLVALGGCFIHWQGFPALLVGCAAVVFVLAGAAPRRVIALPVVVLLAFLAAQPYPVARALAPAIPWVSLCVAVLVSRISSGAATRSVASASRIAGDRGAGRPVGIRNRWVAYSIAGGALCAYAAPPITRGVIYEAPRSDVAAAASLMEQLEGVIALPLDTTARSKYALYLGGAQSGPVRDHDGMTCDVNVCRHPPMESPFGRGAPGKESRYLRERYYRLGEPADVIERLRERGVRWVVTDPQCWHYRDLARFADDPVVSWCKRFEAALRESGRLIAEFPHLEGALWELASEGPGPSIVAEMIAHDAGPIRVFDIAATDSVTSAR